MTVAFIGTVKLNKHLILHMNILDLFLHKHKSTCLSSSVISRHLLPIILLMSHNFNSEFPSPRNLSHIFLLYRT